MTKHLPECLHDDDTYGLRGLCICDELRACEQRVLDAAREAVATMTFDSLQRDQGPVATQRQVLAAIDALKEKP